MPACLGQRHLSCPCVQASKILGQLGEVVGGHRLDEAGTYPLGAAMDGQGAAVGFLDPLVVFQRQSASRLATIANSADAPGSRR